MLAQQGFSLSQTCSQKFNYKHTKIGDKMFCVKFVRMCVCVLISICQKYVLCGHVLLSPCVRLYTWHTTQLTYVHLHLHFIRDQFDLRQFLAMLLRYCRRQQLGQLAEKDGKGGGCYREAVEKKGSLQ